MILHGICLKGRDPYRFYRTQKLASFVHLDFVLRKSVRLWIWTQLNGSPDTFGLLAVFENTTKFMRLEGNKKGSKGDIRYTFPYLLERLSLNVISKNQ